MGHKKTSVRNKKPANPAELALTKGWWGRIKREFDSNGNPLYTGYNWNYAALVGDLDWTVEKFVWDVDENPIDYQVREGVAYAERNTLFAETEWEVNGITLNTGTYVIGDVDSVKKLEGEYYMVREVGGTPGFNIELDWAGVGGFDRLELFLNYDGSAAHTVDIEIYNTISTNWDNVTTIATFSQFYLINEEIVDTNYIDAGVVKARIYHTSAGNASHYLYLDHAALITD